MTNEHNEIGQSADDEAKDARRAAASAMGRARTERKAATSRENGRLFGGAKIKPIMDIECSCGSEALLREDGTPAHPTTCPRGRVIRWRLKKGLPLT